MIQFDEHFFQRGWKQPPTTRKNHPPTETEDTSIFDLPGILWRHNSTDPPAYIYLIEQATDGRGAWPMWNNQSSHIFSKLPHNPTRMSQEVSKWLVSGYNPNIPHLYVGYNPFTNHLLTSWDIQAPPAPPKKESPWNHKNCSWKTTLGLVQMSETWNFLGPRTGRHGTVLWVGFFGTKTPALLERY